MVLLKQPLSRVTVGSIGLAFAGVVVLSLDGISKESSAGAPNPVLGDIVMLFGKSLFHCQNRSFRVSEQDVAR
jgi:drug/metabolite transporter (DMT)-like permease